MRAGARWSLHQAPTLRDNNAMGLDLVSCQLTLSKTMTRPVPARPIVVSQPLGRSSYESLHAVHLCNHLKSWELLPTALHMRAEAHVATEWELTSTRHHDGERALFLNYRSHVNFEEFSSEPFSSARVGKRGWVTLRVQPGSRPCGHITQTTPVRICSSSLPARSEKEEHEEFCFKPNTGTYEVGNTPVTLVACLSANDTPGHPSAVTLGRWTGPRRSL